MFAIAGVTGNTGRFAAETLLGRGARVRVIVRDAQKGAPWAARGAEVAVASLDDPAAVTAALRGAEGAWLLLPPSPTEPRFLASREALARNLARAITDSGIPHVAFLSSFSAHADAPGPIRSVAFAEELFRPLPTRFTFLRPSSFVENWAAGVPVAKAEGVLPSFLPAGVRVPHVSVRDIGRVAAERLLAPPAATEVIELTGPEDASAEDVAQALGRVLGRPVAAQALPLDAVVPTFKSFGFSDNVAGLYRELYAAVAAGRLSFERPDRVVRGTVTLDDALRPLAG